MDPGAYTVTCAPLSASFVPHMVIRHYMSAEPSVCVCRWIHRQNEPHTISRPLGSCPPLFGPHQPTTPRLVAAAVCDFVLWWSPDKRNSARVSGDHESARCSLWGMTGTLIWARAAGQARRFPRAVARECRRPFSTARRFDSPTSNNIVLTSTNACYMVIVSTTSRYISCFYVYVYLYRVCALNGRRLQGLCAADC